MLVQYMQYGMYTPCTTLYRIRIQFTRINCCSNGCILTIIHSLLCLPRWLAHSHALFATHQRKFLKSNQIVFVCVSVWMCSSMLVCCLLVNWTLLCTLLCTMTMTAYDLWLRVPSTVLWAILPELYCTLNINAFADQVRWQPLTQEMRTQAN